MNIIKLSKFYFFFFLNCVLVAMPLELKRSVDECEKKFNDFSSGTASVQISQETIGELLIQFNGVLSELKSYQNDSLENSSDADFEDEISYIALQYESDIWFLNELKNLLFDFQNERLFKKLYNIASNSQRYHYVIVKLMKDYEISF